MKPFSHQTINMYILYTTVKLLNLNFPDKTLKTKSISTNYFNVNRSLYCADILVGAYSQLFGVFQRFIIIVCTSQIHCLLSLMYIIIIQNHKQVWDKEILVLWQEEQTQGKK